MSDLDNCINVSVFSEILERYVFRRKIVEIHLHHTWKPRKKDFKGVSTIEGMRNYHVNTNGWNDIAQHLTIDPDGGLWIGRDWNAPPASAKGCNGNRSEGPFMIEMIGDFDEGEEVLEGDQLGAVIDCLAELIISQGLDVEDLVFHRDCAGAWKSCPGTGIQRKELLDLIEKKIEINERSKSHTPYEDIERATHLTERMITSDRGSEERGMPFFGGGRVDQALLPHIVGSSNGRFDEGEEWMSEKNIDRLFSEHLPEWLDARKAHGVTKHPVVLYAHGGLVSESGALDSARTYIPWWKTNGVYPIFFIWKTGLLETIGDQIGGWGGKLFGRRQRDRGVGEWLDDRKDALLEKVVHKTRARRVTWDDMKNNAARCFDEKGVGSYFLTKLAKFLSSKAGEGVTIEMIGHSAGAIFHSRFAECFQRQVGSGDVTTAQKNEMVKRFNQLHLMAPALRVDEFKQRVVPQTGKKKLIKGVSMFTMKDYWERKDRCGKVYGKSLLYLVQYGLEDRVGEPLLGMQTSLAYDRWLRSFFGVDGTFKPGLGELILSKTGSGSSQGWRSVSGSHGGFDDDSLTLESILYRITGRKSAVNFPKSRKRNIEGVGADQYSAYAPHLQKSRGGVGVSRSLCVGIDQYASSPLYGCVNDANEWARVFDELGSQSVDLVTDRAATRLGILDAFQRVARSSKSGDTIWFQYAGHGAQLPDVSGDELGGDSPGYDEILCPYDIDDGEPLLDDDIGKMIDQVAPGVRVVCFIDACHSGTGTRVLFQMRQRGGIAQRGGVKERFMHLGQALTDRCVNTVRSRSNSGFNPYEGKREILFSACNSRQTAKEENGHGIFTTAATRVLRGTVGGGNLSCDSLLSQIRGLVDPRWNQTPELHCDDTMRAGGIPGMKYDAAASELYHEPQIVPSDSSFMNQGYETDDMVRRIELLEQIL